MDTYTLTAIVLSLAVLIGYVNHRYIKMQNTIAIMVSSLGISLVLIVLQHSGITDFARHTQYLLIQTDFHRLLINGMLSFLLFAGALTIDFNALKNNKWEIGILASLGTIASALLIGCLSYYLIPLFGFSLPFNLCLLFGALISPTDPIAVLATFKKIGAPRSLTACVAGESLFNDGVGIVLFLTLYQLSFNHIDVTWQNVSLLFLQQAVGGIVYGGVLGMLVYRLIQKVNDPKNSILLSLVIASGGYTLAMALNISGPLAMVVCGIYIGNKLRHSPTQKHISRSLDLFWEVIDELLNAILFLLIGFELLVVNAGPKGLMATLLMIPLVLAVRLVTVAVPITFLKLKFKQNPYTISILTWGGLRGGLAVALALSLPASSYRDIILTMTYGIVAFAIIVQGLTIKYLAQRATAASTQDKGQRVKC